MNTPRSFVRVHGTKILGIIAAAGVAASPAAAEPNAPMNEKPAVAVAPVHPAAVAVLRGPITVAPITAEQERWRKDILTLPRPKNGCFTAAYPDRQWREVPCTTAPHKLYPPQHGGMSRIDTVGGAGPDFSATVTGHITQSEGSFDTASGISKECSVACPGQVCPASPSCSSNTNAYTLQLNTAPFTTSACSGSPNPSQCSGWEQFVYEGGGGGFIQYWLLQYGPAGTLCPTPRHSGCAAGTSYSDGWCPFQFSPTGDVYCVVNGPGGSSAPSVASSSLGSLKVRGSAAGVMGSTSDSMVVSVGATPYTAPGGNYFPDLGSQWNEAEFNVFGDGNGSQAVFNSGTTLQVRTGVISGTSSGPGCHLKSWTGESNNLTLANSPPSASTGTMPALVFASTNPPPSGGAATCADAVSLGDTHLTTFGGLLYDFQAMGDFLLAETGPEFRVETRQVSGAPTWPNAAVNQAVGVLAGKNRVAVCLPDRVVIDGKPARFPDNGQIALPGGGVVARRSNMVIVMGPTGDSMNATLNGSHIDVTVGLGRSPDAKVRGLLANVNGKVDAIAARDGAALTAPIAFQQLYGHYAESWRVRAAGESLLAPCGEAKEIGVPKAPFYANNLPPELAKRNRDICMKYGARGGALLNACMIDVAMLGPAAARAYAGRAAPVVVGDAGGKREPYERDKQ